MTPIRLVVSDVDGTLVDKDKALTPGVTDAVARLEARGIGFSIVSARPRSGMMPIADTLGIDAPMGAFNGGTVFKRDGTVLAHHPIDEEVARGVWAALEGEPVDVWLFADDQWYATTDEGDHVASERRSSNQEPAIVAREAMAAMLDRADKLTFVSDDEPLLRSLHGRVKPAFGTRATIVQSQTYYLDVTANQGNKGAGIAALAAAFEVPLGAVAAIGDQNNDLPMLEQAGYGIAMGNGTDDVKAAADATTRANDADGVAWAIDHLILPRTGAPQ